MGDMRNLTSETRLTLKEMRQKAFREQLCLYVTIVVLLILIALVVYREATNHGRLL